MAIFLRSGSRARPLGPASSVSPYYGYRIDCSSACKKSCRRQSPVRAAPSIGVDGGIDQIVGNRGLDLQLRQKVHHCPAPRVQLGVARFYKALDFGHGDALLSDLGKTSRSFVGRGFGDGDPSWHDGLLKSLKGWRASDRRALFYRRKWAFLLALRSLHLQKKAVARSWGTTDAVVPQVGNARVAGVAGECGVTNWMLSGVTLGITSWLWENWQITGVAALRRAHGAEPSRSSPLDAVLRKILAVNGP